MHKKFSFAGQNLNSIYFISNSGISLRIKPSSLFGNGNIQEALEHACESSFCIDDISDEDYKYKSDEFPLKFVSFEPKIGYRVEEFFTKEFVDHAEGNFKPKIQIIKDKK